MRLVVVPTQKHTKRPARPSKRWGNFGGNKRIITACSETSFDSHVHTNIKEVNANAARKRNHQAAILLVQVSYYCRVLLYKIYMYRF